MHIVTSTEKKMDNTFRAILMTKAWVEANRMGLSPQDLYVCFANLELVYRGRSVTYGLGSTAYMVVELYGLESWTYNRFECRRENTATDLFTNVHRSHHVLASVLEQLMDFLKVDSFQNEFVVDTFPRHEESDEEEDEMLAYFDPRTGLKSYSGIVPITCTDCSLGNCADCIAYRTYFAGEIVPYDPSHLDRSIG